MWIMQWYIHVRKIVFFLSLLYYSNCKFENIIKIISFLDKIYELESYGDSVKGIKNLS